MTAPAIAIGVALALLAAGGLTAGLLRRLLMIAVVTGASMTPTYADGQRLLVRRGRRFRRHDVVVFDAAGWTIKSHATTLVKRVIAVPGDAVPVEMTTAVTDKFVPAGMLLVQGDNPDSLDSRRLGYAPASSVCGVVLRPLISARSSPQRAGSQPPGEFKEKVR